MATSFVRYRGRGFWSYDPYLEHLLAQLAEAIEERAAEPWLRDAGEHWLRQSSGDFAAYIHPMLDEIVTTDDRRDTVLKLVRAVASDAETTPEVRGTAALLTQLLEGTLRTTESSPRDYMVSGDLAYRWRA